jgi:muramidase (phage lysozyme)
MNRTAIAALVLAAVLFWPRRVSAETDPATSDTAPIQPQAIDNPDAVELQDAEIQSMSLPVNVNAFLYMIRSCEHRYPTDVVNDECYEIFYGGTRFVDLSDHPVITGELAPVPLPDHMCKAAGLKTPCYSTAAGAYQFIRPTWTRLRNKLGLDDFGFASQDRAALELLDESGVLSLIEDGEIESAIRKASKIWASLPGNNYQQNPKAMRFALDRFAEGQRLYAQASGELPPLP